MRNEYYMKEYWHFNGDYNIILNLIEVNTVRCSVILHLISTIMRLRGI